MTYWKSEIASMYYTVAALITIQIGLRFFLQIILVAWLFPFWFNTFGMPFTLDFFLIGSHDLIKVSDSKEKSENTHQNIWTGIC